MRSKSNSKKLQTPRRSTRFATINSSLKRTKDNVIIFKVFISYKNENVTKEALIEQFSSFGNIKDHAIINSQMEERIFKCTYYDPISAAQSLRSRFIRLNHSNITIKSCPTCEQPFQVTDYIGNTVTNKSFTSTLNSPPPPQPEFYILSLNDDCLATIFEYLDLKSQLHFSSCNERLENIFINMACARLLNQQLLINTLSSNQLSDWEIWQFFKTVGRYIYGIKLTTDWYEDFSDRNILKLIEEFCTNIQRVQLIQTEKKEHMEIWNFFDKNMLTEIELYGCDMNDKDLEVLVQCRNLTSLGLAKNPRLVGDFLPSFGKLQRLSLYRCRAVTMGNLIETCKNSNLKYLDITTTFGDVLRSDALKHCRNLETLKMTVTCEKDLKNIIILKNLKSLKLYFCFSPFDRQHRIASPLELKKFFNKLNNKLETLKLFYCDENILPNCVGTFFSLRTLWISMKSIPNHVEKVSLDLTFMKLEEIYLNPSYILQYNELLPVVKNCLQLKRIYIPDYEVDKVMDFINSCSEILENCGRNSPLTIFLMDSGGKKFTIIKELTAANINKMLILKQYHIFQLDGLLDDNFPVTEVYTENDKMMIYPILL